MTNGPDYGDLPIETPDQDIYGIDPFVRSLARSVRNMKTPQGVVIALNGPWGSGKSSAINLLKHHLAEAVDNNELDIVTFNPWWFRGEEALVLAFFRELYAATKPALSTKAKKVLPKLGARLLKAGGVVGSAADAFGAAGVGAVASGTMDWLSSLITDEESVDKLHSELAEALRNQKKRFVVLLDDIDRLAPEEALAMFRLVKSVGRLPNVIYVLAFDRMLAEKVVAERFPSEGPHYLEKIVQASFELPEPSATDLHEHLRANIQEIAGAPDESLIVHFMNMFHEILTPEVRTPRDAIRFTNAFSITWPAVAGEVDLGDFLALEAYRLFRPRIYQAIRVNQSQVCGSASIGMERPWATSEQLDAMLLGLESDPTKFRAGLMRLFPKLESVWENSYGDGDGWSKQRRACVADHFPTYFRLSLSDDVISRREIDLVLANVGNSQWIVNHLRLAIRQARRNGGTQAALILAALNVHASDVPIEHVGSLLSGVFSVADELDVEGDKSRGFSIGNNNLRIHWLLRSLLLDRTDLTTRSKILINAVKNASLGWLVDIASSAWEDYHPREGKEPKSENRCLTTGTDADRLIKLSLKAIKSAARNGQLVDHPDLARLLFWWRYFANDNSTAVKRWTSTRLKDDHSVARFAAAFTSHSWGQGYGDFVAIRSDRAQIKGLQELLDLDDFRRRLEAVAKRLAPETNDHQAVVRFLNAWDNKSRFGD